MRAPARVRAGFAALALLAAVAAGGRKSTSPAPAVDRGAFAGEGSLAFVSRGRLWLLDGDTGRLASLTRPGLTASEPQFSPDGRWISYIAGSEVWVARANGAGARPVGPSAQLGGRWLPDGRLVAGTALWRISEGPPVAAGTLPAGLAAWSADGRRFVFFFSTLRVSPPHAASGVERLEVASSLTGPRTPWYVTHVSFNASSGLQGNFLYDAVVLPDDAGVLFRVDPDGSNSILADGTPLYELRAPGERAVKLGVLVGLPISLGARGSFAITNGPNRYAWMTKSVERCDAASATCTPVPTARGILSVDPAWSAAGTRLAFVEAPSSGASDFRQPTVERWYAAHSLWVLGRRSSVPTRLAGAGGASAPRWSADGTSIIYVAGDALWLLRTLSGPPVRVAAPLFTPGDWPTYYGQIDWAGQFAWSSR